jgi:hypothetical protein
VALKQVIEIKRVVITRLPVELDTLTVRTGVRGVDGVIAHHRVPTP